VIRDADGRLLLVRRGHEPNSGQWSIPGGRVERNETDSDALQREVREETCLTVTTGALCGSVVRGPYVIFDYLCAVQSGSATPGSDATEVRWVDGAEFAELDAGGSLVPLLAETLRDWGVDPAEPETD
jgi:8-oxo-dGTP diphosphatase